MKEKSQGVTLDRALEFPKLFFVYIHLKDLRIFASYFSRKIKIISLT